MRSCFIVGLFLGFSLAPIKAQIRFKDPNSPFHYRIDFDTQDLWKEDKLGKWNKLLHLDFEHVDVKELPANAALYSFSQKRQLFLQLEGTGQLYKLDLDSNKLTRVDKTFYRGNNFGAIRFSRADTLFCVGGQGFWRLNNIDTYFSFKTKEWELHHSSSESGPSRIRMKFGGYDQTRDVLSIIELPQIYQNVNIDYLYRYYEKQFSKDRWTYKGDLNVSLLRKLNVQNLESTFIQGIYLYRNGPYVVMADPVKNELYQIDQVIPMLNETFELSEKEGYLYSYYVDKNSKDQAYPIKVDSISIAQLRSLGKYKGEFYVQPISPLVYKIGLGAVLLVLGFLLGFWIKKSKKSKSLDSNTDSEFSILDGLPEGANEFLRASLLLPQGHQFSSQAFTELMGFSTYAYETQRQVRSKLIKAINSYFSVHYKMHDVIIRKTANDDKRFSVYSISEEHYGRLKGLLGESN